MQDEGTIDTYRRVLGIRPGDVAAVEALEDIFGQDERWNELVDVYELHLEAVTDFEYIQTIRTLAAELLRAKLQDTQRAIELLLPILEEDANHTQTLATLGQLYAEQSEWSQCVDMLAHEAEQLSKRVSESMFPADRGIYHSQMEG